MRANKSRFFILVLLFLTPIYIDIFYFLMQPGLRTKNPTLFIVMTGFACFLSLCMIFIAYRIYLKAKHAR